MRFFITAWIAGELCSLFLADEGIFIHFLMPSGIVILIYSLIQAKRMYTKKKALQLFLVGLLALILGFFWTEYLKSLKPRQEIDQRLEGKIFLVQGYIDELPRVMDKGAQLMFHLTYWEHKSVKQKNDQQTLNFPKRILLSYPFTYHQPELIPGDYWEFVIRLQQIRGLKNPHGFDLEQWLYLQDVESLGRIQVFHARRLSDRYRSFKVYIERLRYHIKTKIHQSLGKNSPYAGVMTALVIGDQSVISADDWLIFSKTGIGHLISISGMHVTMFAGVASSLGFYLIQRTRIIYIQPAQYIGACLGFIVAYLYTWLAGFQIPAQRTMIMIGISSLGLFLGRILHPFDIWFWALFLVLFMNPWAIFFPGFWLSFGAVAAILYAMPKDHHQSIDIDLLFLKKLTASLSEATRVQAVVTISLIPLTLFWFYQTSLISPIANAFAIPVISFLVTPFAILGAFLPWILGDLFLHLAHGVFSLLMLFIKPLSEIEYAVIHGAKPKVWQLIIAMVGILITVRPGEILRTWKSRILGLVLCLSLFLPRQYVLDQLPLGEMEMTVWDIGQGSAVLVKTRSHHLLFDTGPTSFGKFDPGEKIIIPHLRAEGIRHLDQLVISHQDADHIGGLSHLLSNFSIKSAMGSIPPNHPLQIQFSKNNVLFQPCQEGMSWNWDGVHFRVWHPDLGNDEQGQYATYKPNEMSCVLEVRNRHHSIWLTGDIEKHAERLLVIRLARDQAELNDIHQHHRILMAPHHGSKTSSSLQLLQILDPDEAFSQTGYRNRFRHPHQEVVERYRDFNIGLLDTVSTGAQIWRTKDKEIHYQQYRR